MILPVTFLFFFFKVRLRALCYFAPSQA